MANDFQVEGTSPDAPFTLKIHRGESMVLLGMNWKNNKPPPRDFVGFAIEYSEPGGDKFFTLTNRLAFAGLDGTVNPKVLSTRLSPIQKFRWVHFPRNAELKGPFTYRVTPVFMNEDEDLSYGMSQKAQIELGLETYANKLNVAFTRGFVSSQAFIDRAKKQGISIEELLPAHASEGLNFKVRDPAAQRTLKWMGFEARNAILQVLDEAIEDAAATVKVIAYDLNEPEVVSRLEKLGRRLQIIIDNSADHSEEGAAENIAAVRLRASAGESNVTRQRMGHLQHNKVIVVDGQKTQAVVCGSTNFSWRAFFVQANNAVVLRGRGPVDIFTAAFELYWPGSQTTFQSSHATGWTDLLLEGLTAKVTFSPHSAAGAVLQQVADDIRRKAHSSVLFSLAFLYQTRGAMFDAINGLAEEREVFVYGISDKKVRGLDIHNADGHMEVTAPAALGGNFPEPFASEASAGHGIQMHHKFVVVDFNTPDARVFTGSFNFSGPADLDNGENLLVIKDRKVATAYMVEAVRLFDHYEFRAASPAAQRPLTLQKAPKDAQEKPWWDRYWTEQMRVKDRLLFS